MYRAAIVQTGPPDGKQMAMQNWATTVADLWACFEGISGLHGWCRTSLEPRCCRHLSQSTARLLLGKESAARKAMSPWFWDALLSRSAPSSIAATRGSRIIARQAVSFGSCCEHERFAGPRAPT